MSTTVSSSPAEASNSIVSRLSDWAQQWSGSWQRFWFTPARPDWLCVLRILVGAMLVYSHLVWAGSLSAFMGADAWIDNEVARQLHDGTFSDSTAARSYLWKIDSPGLLAAHHAFTIAVMVLVTIGLGTRLVLPLAVLLQLMYLHRLTGMLFGLDQIVTYMAMYLALSPCGSRFSIDAMLRERWKERLQRSPLLRWLLPACQPTVMANVATRLWQIHVCVIYLFGGLAKARGETWWDGTAMWYAITNYEYQSLDMTWLNRFPAILALLSTLTLFWEIFYVALIWPRLTRPLVLALAVAVHAGIATTLGMMTFGSMMIVANAIFVSPNVIFKPSAGLSQASQPSEQTGGSHQSR
ncbi:Sporulation-delaying protein SdpB [Stieleria bergensis]|uniref:Sporulation-delaying protein SdpB n=1 Tax=Stieleria bergensis TaxID=2528025 RepID=A0A517SSM8_9BACT|nr:Sporulation-delaying protein SdpB [Planctomycetes bacterium SV_7m_r]